MEEGKGGECEEKGRERERERERESSKRGKIHKSIITWE